MVVSIAATISILMGVSTASAGETLRINQLISSRVAKQFLETVDWEKYGATQINIAEEPAWEDPAIYLDLKEDDWTVEFPNDEFISHTRRLLGDIANPRAVEDDVRVAAMHLLERDLVHVYRLQMGDPDFPDRAIVLTPYTIKASTFGKVIRVKLDDNGLNTREGDLTDGGIDLFRPRD
jgi:hypothetical protein